MSRRRLQCIVPLLPLSDPLPAGTCGGADRAPTRATDRAVAIGAASFRVATGAAGRGEHTATATIATIAATAAVPRLCLDVGEGATGGTTGTTISLGPEERSPGPAATNTATHRTSPTAATLILAALPTFATFVALGQRPLPIFVHLEREERQGL